MRKIILFALIFLSAQVWGSEKDISFSTTAPETVVVGEQFRLSYTINTQNAKDLKFSPGNEFDVLYGPATTYSSVTINGNSRFKTAIAIYNQRNGSRKNEPLSINRQTGSKKANNLLFIVKNF